MGKEKISKGICMQEMYKSKKIWEKPEMIDVSQKVMAQPFIRFT
jgi:hypothetical protein